MNALKNKNSLMVCLLVMLGVLVARPLAVQGSTYTLDADFDIGTLVNVNHDAPNNDQLQLNWVTEPFPFVNIACSARGTIVRIDVNTGQILGEYLSAPQGRGRNPSRTTVDLHGNVWAGNRDEASGGKGSVVKIGLVVGGTRCDADGTPNPAGQYLAPPFHYNTCVDRDGDGLIKTSRGLGNILPWPDVTDGAGGSTGVVEDAEDEAILIYQRVGGDHVRHVSVDAGNNVWTAGNFGADNRFNLLHGNTGAILANFDVGAGGYGGLVDGNKVLWSANRGPGPVTVLRYDTKGTIGTGDDTWSTLNAPQAYGLGIDTSGNIWNAQYQWTGQVRKFSSAGVLLGTFNTGGGNNSYCRGVAVTPVDDNVWVANSGRADVSRLANNGILLKVIPLGGDGQNPTGVAVDRNGKVWVACLGSSTAKRIDPSGGGDGLGAVDMTVSLGAGAGPYNYSDMTGSVLLGAIQQGNWTVVHNSGTPGNTACRIYWNDEPEGAEPAGTSITVEARAADNVVDLPSETFVTVAYGIDPGLTGQYIEVRATLSRDPGVTETPVLSDLTIICNLPPDCSEAYADPWCLWPPNHKMVPVNILGVTDPDGDPVTIIITGITSDEATASDKGAGGPEHAPDADGVGTDTALLRAERSGEGNGRVYEISFIASDGKGGECEGTALVNVPHDQRPSRRSPAPCEAVDDGQNYDATQIN